MKKETQRKGRERITGCIRKREKNKQKEDWEYERNITVKTENTKLPEVETLGT